MIRLNILLVLMACTGQTEPGTCLSEPEATVEASCGDTITEDTEATWITAVPVSPAISLFRGTGTDTGVLLVSDQGVGWLQTPIALGDSAQWALLGQVQAAEPDGDGTIWAVVDGQLGWFDRTSSVVGFTLVDDAREYGDIWVGPDGLAVVVADGGVALGDPHALVVESTGASHLVALAGRSLDDLWAVGQYGVWHRTATGWSKVEGLPGEYEDVAVDADSVWLASNTLLRYDRSTHELHDLGLPPTNDQRALYGLWVREIVLAGDEVWAAVSAIGFPAESQEWIGRWDGAWHSERGTHVSGDGANGVWVFGDHGLLDHHTGQGRTAYGVGAWTLPDLKSSGDAIWAKRGATYYHGPNLVDLSPVTAGNGVDLWAPVANQRVWSAMTHLGVGEDAHTAIWQTDGTSDLTSEIVDHPDGSMHALAAQGEQAWLAGSSGLRAAYDRDGWNVVDGVDPTCEKPSWTTATVADNGTVWLGGRRGIIGQWNDTGLAYDVRLPSETIYEVDLDIAPGTHDVAIAADDLVFLKKESGWCQTALPADSDGWRVRTSSDGDQIWAFGTSGVYRLDGTTWLRETQAPDLTELAATETGLWGTSEQGAWLRRFGPGR